MEKSSLPRARIRLKPARSRSRWLWPLTLCTLIAVGATAFVAHSHWVKPATAEAALRSGDYPMAMELLKASADKGDLAAQNAIGNLYALGLGVKRDRVTAGDWYKKAAFAGNSSARVNMGHLYNHAFSMKAPTDRQETTNPNAALSYAWFNLARNQGHPQAQLYMSELLWGHRQIHHLVNEIRRDYATIRNFQDTPPPDISP